MPSSPPPNLDGFLAELLHDQQRLQTPVTRAATAHSLQPSAWRAERFRELIPLTSPGPGQQYAFEVDLDSCSGCKACVSGCHSLNGLDDEETWRDVGVVYGLSALAAPSSAERHAPAAPAYQQTVTTACHHCEDPACLNGCPVLAYEKDPVTGIVRHLDDQCIGCSYCVLKCPYDVPKYNERLGIVRKCDLCHGRLAAGEAPACAQACPTQAIRVVTVSTTASSPYDAVVSLPQDPSYTRPTTRYVSQAPIPARLHAADAAAPRPQHAHYALVFLLVGTQLSLGLLTAGCAALLLSAPPSQITHAAAAALFFAALVASVAHLGQPLRAWRIFLGLRRSWLSREAVILGAAAPLVALVALTPLLPVLESTLTLVSPALADRFHALAELAARHSSVTTLAATGLTALGVFCSAMIYIDTRRHFWRPANTAVRMGGTVGIAALAFLPIAFGPVLAAAALTLKLILEHRLLGASPVSLRLYNAPLRPLSLARRWLGAATIGAFLATPVLASMLPTTGQLVLPLLGLALLALGEACERTLYFSAVDAPKMPGQPAA